MATQDRILLEGLLFYAFHGVNPEEKVLGQRFVVDIAMHRDLHAAGASDDLNETTSYSAVYKQVRAIVEGGPYDLIETVAERIAATILDTYPPVEDVRVTIRKPDVAMRGSMFTPAGGVGIEVFRTRATAGKTRE